MYFGSLKFPPAPTSLGIIIIPGKPSERVPGVCVCVCSVCVRVRACVCEGLFLIWVSSSGAFRPSAPLFPPAVFVKSWASQRAPCSLSPWGAEVTLACGASTGVASVLPSGFELDPQDLLWFICPFHHQV